MVTETKRLGDYLLAVALLVGSTGVLAAGVSSSSNPNSGPITTKNWMTHPSTKTVRVTVADVVDGMESGKIRTEEIVYDIISDECADHIVTISETIGFDADGTVRYYKNMHFVAPEIVGFTEHFLDEKGTTLFLYSSHDEEGWKNSRAYFNESGNGVFRIEQIDGNYLKDRMNADEYYRLTSENIKRSYKMKAECPIEFQQTLSKTQVIELLSDKQRK